MHATLKPSRPGEWFTGLWRHPDFLKFWGGQTVSQFGTQVTYLALPLVAVLSQHAGPAEMGLLTALDFAPFLLFGLFAGAWVDRWSRRRVLIVADGGRALLLAVIPAAALLGRLSMGLLYAVAFLTGALAVFFEVAYQAYLPSLVGRGQLVEGNSKLEVSRSAATTFGPGLAGWLVQLCSAPLAISLDALSFVVSAVTLAWVRTAEPAAAAGGERHSLRAEIGEGLKLVLGNPVLRALAFASATFNLCLDIAGAVWILYAVHGLGFSPGTLGLVTALGNVGFLAGAFLVTRAARRLGVGRAAALALLLGAAGYCLIALAGSSRWGAAALVVLGLGLFGAALPVYNVNQVSLRQAMTPPHLLGRVGATMRFLVYGAIPVGALLGGALGNLVGLRPTLVVGALGMLTACLWLRFSPVWCLRDVPGQTAGAA